ncbi:hypothetical protein KK062_20345 [Fulvivirgaceae bacterium PWU5]|uniref:Uncharacterized protein n=1 Tax=Dawidia cretensis TaxID=2782350 RepID=A0AAP2E0P0_9BACT|nr:hypothetical protein [Dawidia cretensis]MBT1710605.1 hypothetical protein [Dawidia cretensis]
MHWQELKDKIYFEDGSLRDIYVLNTTKTDWKKWIDLVNEKYIVEFYDAKTESTSDKIDLKIVEEYWESNDRETIQAKIKLNSIIIMCYFFDDGEIENDIDPRGFKSMIDHDNFLNYLNDISVLLNKEVYVTDENTQSSILLKKTPPVSP